MAFSPSGSISKEDLNEVNGLKIWFANTMEQIEEELKEVQNVHPIFYGHDNVFTEWHIWTSDGHRRNNYKTYNWDTDSCLEWSYQWFYMNWGWNGKWLASRPDDHPDNKNGWYASGVFQPTGSSTNYNNNLRMITGIR